MIIGLVGPKGHGKTTVASILEARGFLALSFAQAIREAAEPLFGIDAHEFEVPGDKDDVSLGAYGLSRRQILDAIGKAVRDINPQIIIDRVDEMLVAGDAEGYDLVVSDVRTDAEAEKIKDRGGRIFYVMDPRKERGERSFYENPKMMRHCVGVIFNGGTIDELEDYVDCIVFRKEPFEDLTFQKPQIDVGDIFTAYYAKKSANG